MRKQLFYVSFLTIFLFVLVASVIFISRYIQEKIPPEDNYQIFETQKETLDFFRNYKSEKTEQFISSATMIAPRPEQICESDDDCSLVSNYFSSLQVSCKLDPDAPGDWLLCPTQIPNQNSGSKNPQEVQASTEVPKRYQPEAGDSRYQWSEVYYSDCLNPANLNESERDNLKTKNSSTYKCSCFTLAEYSKPSPLIEGTSNGSEGKITTYPEGEQVPPPTPFEDTGEAKAEISEIPEESQAKYCLRLRKTSDLIISNIDVPDYPLETGDYSFNITIKNLGPDKCCETYQATELFKNGEDLGGLGIHTTYPCWYSPEMEGILPNQSVETQTGKLDFNEPGTYTLKSYIKCLLPEEGNIDNGIFEANLQIE